MSYFLSVIIPCFNSGETFLKYYRSALISIKDVEFIIIDDCSNDNSFELLKNNIKQPNFLIVQTEKNSGPGVARNIGIQSSTGDYITFLDSDDRFDDSFFSSLKQIISKDYDLIYFDYLRVEKNKQQKKHMLFSNNKETDIGNVMVFSRGCPWGKIYKSSIIKNNNVEFLNLKRNEDTPFTKVAISHCKSVLYVDTPFYLYYQNNNSLMHDDSLFDNKNTIAAWEYINSNISMSISNEAKDAIYLKEYVLKKCLYDLNVLKKKQWVNEVNMLISNKKNLFSNKYLSRFPISYRFVFFLIRHKCFTLLKILHR